MSAHEWPQHHCSLFGCEEGGGESIMGVLEKMCHGQYINILMCDEADWEVGCEMMLCSLGRQQAHQNIESGKGDPLLFFSAFGPP